MKSLVRSAVTFVWLVALAGSPLTAQQPATATMTIRTPVARTYAVALDELWIQAGRDEGAWASRLDALGLSQQARHGRLVVARVSGARTPQDVAAHASRIRRATPEAEPCLALYDRNAPRDDEHRSLLTSQVALLVDPGVSASELVGRGGRVREVAGVPNAFVVDTDDPLAGVALADALARRPGVRQAYPLVRTMEQPR